MHVIQLARSQWLILTDDVKPRMLITQGPMVHDRTRETLIVHRVEWWSVERSQRKLMAVHETYEQAVEWCRAELGRIAAQNSPEVAEAERRKRNL